jgi:hypothetical protein
VGVQVRYVSIFFFKKIFERNFSFLEKLRIVGGDDKPGAYITDKFSKIALG